MRSDPTHAPRHRAMPAAAQASSRMLSIANLQAKMSKANETRTIRLRAARSETEEFNFPDEDRILRQLRDRYCPVCGWCGELHRHRELGKSRYVVLCSNKSCINRTGTLQPSSQDALAAWKLYVKLAKES